MTTPTKPLSYLTSKCVALYMDANKRLQLYLRCPSFASAHMNEAMRIRDLKVRPENFEMDGTVYKLELIIQYTDTPNPRSVVLVNAKGGIQEHVDIYGLPPRRTQDEAENAEADNAEIASLRRSIATMEQDRAKPGNRIRIERLNLKAEAYNMRINNTPPPFRHYLQLTISTGKLVKIERVVYDKQFGIGKEYIEKMVFGNKTIQVEHLQIGGDYYLLDSEKDRGIQFGPPRHEPLFAYTPQTDSVKPLLSIQSIEVGVLRVTGILINALASLRPILSQTPLKRLKAVCHRRTFPEDPIVNTTEFLHIASGTSINELSNRSNYRIHIGLACKQSDYDLIDLIDEWKKRELQIGTYYSMGTTRSSVDPIFIEFRNIPGAELGENEESIRSLISSMTTTHIATSLIYSCGYRVREARCHVMKANSEAITKNMTTRPKPLFYETSKCVALYMDPHKRLQLYLRCPSFASAHKSEPMRIRDLKLRPDNFEINGTIYSLGVITQYTDTPNPRSVVWDNAEGGIQEHVDIYGLPPRLTQDDAENVRTDNVQMTNLRDSITRMNRDLRPGNRIKIQRLNLKAEAYKMRINNTPPPYRLYLQLTISTGKLVKIERVVYDKQIVTAKEYIEKMVFGNKNFQVGHIQIGGDEYLNVYHYHFRIQHGPPRHEPLFGYTPQTDNVKPLLSIRSLEVGLLKVTGILTNALASLRPILSQTPLKELKAVCHQYKFPEDPIVNTTNFLQIAHGSPINVLSNRPNYRIHLGVAFQQTDDDLINLVNEWKKREIRIGTYYSMGGDEDLVTPIFTAFRNIPGAKLGENEQTRLTKFPECIIIPMGNDTELNVYCNEPDKEEKEYCRSQFIVKMKWQPRGYARATEW
ncbi:hypothetical protein CRE_12056 [Caenorhabditis remanei]|uniref:Uncharacterized protein n=1 Tax=Caenorhabditis remanei TaxID=31234 RepID=E3MPP0_CAERE|nr:hypothetical protein CRE_12056 [Caenorhabditis remanei]